VRPTVAARISNSESLSTLWPSRRYIGFTLGVGVDGNNMTPTFGLPGCAIQGDGMCDVERRHQLSWLSRWEVTPSSAGSDLARPVVQPLCALSWLSCQGGLPQLRWLGARKAGGAAPLL
jgi:hypothetical protein